MYAVAMMTRARKTMSDTNVRPTPDPAIARTIRDTWRNRPEWAASSPSAAARRAFLPVAISTGGHARDESGIAPGEVSRGALRAGRLIELLGHVTTRRGEGAYGLEEGVPTVPEARIYAFFRAVHCDGCTETKLRRCECREVVGPSRVVNVASVTAHCGTPGGRPAVVDRVLRIKQGLQPPQGGLH